MRLNTLLTPTMFLIVDVPYHYCLLDREFFETLDRLEPRRADYIDSISQRLPAGWRVTAHGVWCYVEPPQVVMPSQGWKIHVSGTTDNASMVLAAAAGVLVDESVSFKFAVDRRVLHLMNSKRWRRGAAGKLMTIYPRDEEQCARLMAQLDRRLVGFNGPVILSDRQYREHSIVHYRYGGFAGSREVDIDGRLVPTIQGADGTSVADERNGFFQLPAGIRDPFQPAAPAAADGYPEGTLNEGRYLVERAVVFSNAGGVYIATDTTSGARVLIKEARPFAGVTKYGDSVLLLKKEERILRALEHTGVVPRFIELFRDWEHYYLVEEFIDGVTLRGYNAGHAVLLRTRPTRDLVQNFIDAFCALYQKIAAALRRIHECGIVLVDVSHYNLIVSRDGQQVRFIDFDGAYEPGVDVPTFMQTPGFAPNDDITVPRTQADDWYGFGSLMLSTLFPMNDMMQLTREAFRPFLASWVRDAGIPPEICDCITSLLDRDAQRRPAPEAVVRVLERRYEAREPKVTTFEFDNTNIRELVRGIARYIRAKLSPDRADRVAPAAADVFMTNPLSVAFGAAGVAHALHRLEGEVPHDVVDWILQHRITADRYSPGLYVGMTGIAWTLLSLGCRDDAERIARSTHAHPQLWKTPDLYNGVAGWGMGQLRFFLETGDERYLEQARLAGEHLVHTRVDSADGRSCLWHSGDHIFCGLGHGSAGIALFLLYLARVTGDDRYLATGRLGMAHAIDGGVPNPDGGLSWLVTQDHVTRTPYWRWGSAGVGIALLRYEALLGDRVYTETLDQLHLDTDRKFAIFPGFQTGLAGIADFYLDWRRFHPNDPRADESARRLLSGVLLFKMDRDGGVAFPGETRTHISCDFATGSAGIGSVFQRTIDGAASSYLLDDLLPAAAVYAEASGRRDVVASAFADAPLAVRA